MTSDLPGDDAWVPSACTLPGEDRPLRVAEFEDFFTGDVTRVATPTPGQLRVEVRPDAASAARAASLGVRETACCSFFTFELAISEGAVALTIGTGPEQEDVLAALGEHVEALLAGAAR
jgi:hypothetical protein